MHIAVCVSGEMRALKENWTTLERYLNKPGRTYEVFLHTWTQPKTGRVFRNYDRHMGKQWSPLVYSNQEAIDTLKPTRYIIEDNTTEIVDNMADVPPYTDGRHRVQSMWRGWYISSQLALLSFRRNHPFDVVCRIRTDLIFKSDPYEIFESIKPPKGFIFVPQYHNGGDPELSYKMGLHDFFGAGCLASFIKFASIYNFGNYYLPRHPDGFFSEILLKSHCDKIGLKVIRYPVDYQINRV